MATVRADPAPAGDLFAWAGEEAPVAVAPPPEPVPTPMVGPAAPAPAAAAPPARPVAPARPLPQQMPVAPVARPTGTTLYIVIPYSDRSAGKGTPRWRPGTATSFADPSRALRAAESCIGRGGVVGALVGRQTADADAGEYGEPEIIGRFGRVPTVED